MIYIYCLFELHNCKQTPEKTRITAGKSATGKEKINLTRLAKEMVKALIKPVNSLYHSMVKYGHTCAYDMYKHLIWWPSPEVIKLIPCSTQLNMTFKVLIKTKTQKIKKSFAF